MRYFDDGWFSVCFVPAYGDGTDTKGTYPAYCDMDENQVNYFAGALLADNISLMFSRLPTASIVVRRIHDCG